MDDLEIIRETVERVGRRRRWQRGWRGFWRGLLAGGCVWLGGVVFYKVFPLPGETLLWTGGLAVLAVFMTLARSMGRRETELATARWVDRNQQLQERLSTAWELAQQNKGGEWRDLLVADAAQRVRDFELAKALPYGMPKWAGWIVLVLALGAGMGFVPEYRSPRYVEERAVEHATREAGKQLSELTARQLEKPPALESTHELLTEVEELGLRLGKVELNRDQALRELASVAERLREELAGHRRSPSLRRLEKGSGSGKPEATAEMRSQAEALQEQLGRQSADASAAEKLAAGLEALRQAAANLPSGASASAEADQAQARIAEAMAELARQAEAMGVELPSLDEAMRALESGRMDQVLQQLQFAAIDLEQLAKMSRALEQLQAQLADIGRDLPEQLERGQGWPAIATLQRMQEMLKDRSPTQEETDQLIDELKRSVTPGNEYGRVGELLASAVREMEKENRGEAANQLGEAAAELLRLMEQLGDATELTEALGNLQTAQMCIGNCQGWGLSRSQIPGFRPGGRPGRGVGTWADEGSTLAEGQSAELWDNSGVVRPDLAERGESDRGAGEPSSALVPTQVRGQISPGGSMPAVTLRGLSVRGQSRVEYQEAVTSAQVDAQSALSQERVPRAYRGTVREYFDDLKE